RDPRPFDPRPRKLVANLPYHIVTPLVLETLEHARSIEHWCVMVQREVADRFFAAPRTKAYGAVSVLVQLAAAKVGFHPVPPTVFRPRPRGDSALVAFSQRRKMLANSIALAGLASRTRVEEALTAIGRSPKSRAEELTPFDFVDLAAALR